MTVSPLAPRPTSYRLAGVFSLVFHALLVLGVVVSSALHGCGPAIQLTQVPVAAHLVRLGTPRDPKLLPRMPTDPPPPPPTPKAAPVPEPAPTPTPTPSVAAKPTPAPSPAAPAAAKTDPTRKLDDILKKYSGKNPGKSEPVIGMASGDPEGDAERAAEGDRYLALVRKRIMDAFQVPSIIPDQERIRLKTSMLVYIDGRGKIVRHEVVRSSSNALFDSAAEGAIGKASQMPPPPESLRSVLAGGVTVDFHI